jgi:predicted dehydrogenase
VVSPHNFESGTGENPTIPKSGQDFYRIFGSEGSLSVPDLTRWTYGGGNKSWTENLSQETSAVPEVRAPFELQMEHFVKVVRGLEEPSCSGFEGLRAVIVCDAIKRSMREQRPVEITTENSLVTPSDWS